ncbi:ABC transporter permease [Patescibacteria group bacterium]|nr:ABC transporter permease [Patescibacteria group bacterium]
MYKFLGNVKLAIKAIWGKKIRSFLTMLGVIIGVFSIVLLIGIGEGVKDEVTGQIEGLGSNIIMVMPGSMGGGPMASSGSFSLEDMNTIKTVEGIEYAVPMAIVPLPIALTKPVAPSELDQSQLASLAESSESEGLISQARQQIVAIGSTHDMENAFKNSEMASGEHSGRIFNEEEYNNASKVATLRSGAVEILFPDTSTEDIVGQTIYIGKEPFTIIGAEEPVDSESFLDGGSVSNMVFIPMSTLEELTDSIDISQFVVTIKDVETVDIVKEDIRQALLETREGVEDFSITTQEEILSMFDQILSVLTTMLGGIAAISLLVGGIGVMNIMLVSVTERTYEIGLRKAIGASDNDVLIQFLMEAIFLTFLGGTIGVVLAFGGAAIMDTQFGFAPTINLQTVSLAYSFTALVGIVFGVAPAVRASKLDPIKALRYE